MNRIVEIFFEANLIFGILYLYYHISIRNEKLFKLRRVFILLIPAISVLFPGISLPAIGFSGTIIPNIQMDPLIIYAESSPESGHFILSSLIQMLYVIVCSFLFTILMIRLTSLILLTRKKEHYKINGSKIIESQKSEASFSFFNAIVIGKNISENDKKSIIFHELAHIRYFHTLDILFLEFIKIIFWINPFVWLASREIKNVHELQVDDYVLKKGIDKVSYMQLILNQCLARPAFKPVNYFNQKFIKKRFIMMSEEKKSKKWSIQTILLLPLILALFYFISCNKQDKTENLDPGSEAVENNNEVSLENTGENNNKDVFTDDKVFSEVDVAPQFPGGNQELTRFMIANIKYPEKARKNGIAGSVMVEFIIDKNGTPTNFKVSRSVDEELDQEALRVLGKMPQWEPGQNNGKPVNVTMSLPINFQLN